MGVLDDGSYEVQVVDAEDHDDRSRSIELVITSGRRKGETLWLRAANLAGASTDLLGLPGTLRVEGGRPTLTL